MDVSRNNPAIFKFNHTTTEQIQQFMPLIEKIREEVRVHREERMNSIKKGLTITSSSLSFTLKLGEKSNLYGLNQVGGKWILGGRLTKSDYQSFKESSNFNQITTHTKREPTEPRSRTSETSTSTSTSTSKSKPTPTPISTSTMPPFAIFNKAEGVILVPDSFNFAEGETMEGPDGKQHPLQKLTKDEESQLVEAMDEYFVLNDLILEKKDSKKDDKETHSTENKLQKDTVTINSKARSDKNDNREKIIQRERQLEKESRVSENSTNEKTRNQKDALKKEILKEEINKEHSKKRANKKHLAEGLLEQATKDDKINRSLVRQVQKIPPAA